jgi:UDP-N-acetylglucosamine 1-carboxyvinyltransferase
MVLAGLVAVGSTRISELQYLDRGYEDITGKLKGLGADITRYPEDAAPAYRSADASG